MFSCFRRSSCRIFLVCARTEGKKQVCVRTGTSINFGPVFKRQHPKGLATPVRGNAPAAEAVRLVQGVCLHPDALPTCPRPLSRRYNSVSTQSASRLQKCENASLPRRCLHAHLGGNFVQTADADHEDHLGLRGHVEATLGLGLALEADNVLLLCAPRRQDAARAAKSTRCPRRYLCSAKPIVPFGNIILLLQMRKPYCSRRLEEQPPRLAHASK